MEIVNIQYGKDQITLDTRCSQIRYCHNIKNRGKIDFHHLSYDDVSGYEWLFTNRKLKSFKDCIAEDMKNFGVTRVKMDIKKMRIMKQQLNGGDTNGQPTGTNHAAITLKDL